MKKGLNIMLAIIGASVVFAASCAKETPSEPIQGGDKEPLSFAGVGESSDPVKSQLADASGSVVWSEGDCLSVFSMDASEHSNNKATSTLDAQNQGKAHFATQIEVGTKQFAAVYPYDANAAYNNGTLTTVLPATQTATAGSFANGASLALAVASRIPGDESESEVIFQNLCSVLSFTLPSNITFANKITVTSKSGAKMAGNVSVDCSQKKIASATSSSVVLNGSFTGGSTYYITVAPGTYASGFSFLIETKGGNSYSRETTKDVVAAAGKLYPLGALSLALTNDAFSTSMSISHDVVSNTLKGSTASFNLSLNKSEFGSAIKSCSTVVTLKNGSSVVCRSKTVSGTSANKVALDIQNGFYYLPKGNYTYTAEVTYTVNNGTKDVQRVLTYNGNVASPQPSGFAIGLNLSGYTSYSCYKGTDGQSASVDNANAKDNATIYAVGATYANGLTPDVYNQCSSLLSISSTLDGAVKSGDQGGQSWAAHTIGGNWSFDGASGTSASTTTVYVTGLPYRIDTKSSSFGWTQTGDFDDDSNCVNWATCTKGGQSRTAYALSPKFPVPADVNIKIEVPSYVYGGSLPKNMHGTMYIGQSSINAKVGSGTSISSSSLYPKQASFDTVTRDIALTGSVGVVCVAVDCTRDKSASVYAKPAGVFTKYIKISYR